MIALAEQAATGPSLLSLCVVALGLLCVGVAWLYRAAYLDAATDARMWERRARAAGWMPSISETQARQFVADLFPSRFPRPLGARPAEDALSLSTVEDAARLRAWRERRAVTSIDHHTKHFAEGAIPSEWAREVLAFCVSDRETMEGE